jgi:hypothetical protein
MPKWTSADVQFRLAAKSAQSSSNELKTNKVIDGPKHALRRFPKAPPATLHYQGVGWDVALCGAVRKLGQLILTIGADCPKCLELKAAQQPQKEASHVGSVAGGVD